MPPPLVEWFIEAYRRSRSGDTSVIVASLHRFLNHRAKGDFPILDSDFWLLNT